MKGTRFHRGNTGFTLVELLVSMAIFTIVAVVAGFILNRVTALTQHNENRTLGAADFRIAMDRMSADWNSSIFPGEHPPVFGKAPVNDRFAFYSNVRAPDGSGAAPRLSLLEYAVRPAASPPAGQAAPETLHRLIEAVGWEDFVKTPGNPTEGEPLADGIFRLELAFLSSDGAVTAAPPTDLSTLRAIVVATASLDPASLRKLSQADAETLAGCLPDCQDGEMPIQNWNAQAFAGLPAFVRENVQFQQRYLSCK